MKTIQALGGVGAAKIMVEILKSAVLRCLSGEAPVFNPRYVDFARHYGFTIAPCNVGAGLEITDFSLHDPIAWEWLDEVANVRTHGETRRGDEGI